jgi:hypothetical protein
MHMKVDIGEATRVPSWPDRRGLRAGTIAQPQGGDRLEICSAQAEGIESNGMIVAASVEDSKPVLAGFHEEIPPEHV